MESDERKRSQRHQHALQGGPSGFDIARIFTGLGVSDAGLLILLIIVLIGGVVFVVYFVAIVFLNLISFGEVHRASVYCSKVRRYSIEEPKGCLLSRNLVKMNLYFTVVLFILTAEEAIRYFLNTGPATTEIWLFRIACLTLFAAILTVFLFQLSKWMGFKSRLEFLKAKKEIEECEKEGKLLYQKGRTPK